MRGNLFFCYSDNMKNLSILFCLFLSLTIAVGFKVGDSVELDQYLNGRTDSNFLKYNKNIKTTLAVGVKGEIAETKRFSSGNYGLKLKVSSGENAGKSYWVYYDVKNPTLHLLNKNKEESKMNIESATTAVTVKPTLAVREMSEHAVVESVKEVSKILDKGIDQATTPKANVNCPPEVKKIESCPDCFSPQMALADLNSSTLKFMGRDLMPGHDQNRSCVFENEKVYVAYHNCTGNRKEAPALDFEVISKNGGKVGFYLETTGAQKNSLTPRSKFDGTWTVNFSPTAAPGKLTMNGMKAFIEGLDTHDLGGCFVGESFKGASPEAKVKCYGDLGDKGLSWGTSAEAFWIDPGTSWLPTQAKLRKLVETAPF
jgi:hypothetical protein